MTPAKVTERSTGDASAHGTHGADIRYCELQSHPEMSKEVN